MTKQKYWLERLNAASEKALRSFFLQKADILCMTSTRWTEWEFPFKIRRYGGDADKKFVDTTKSLRTDLVKKKTNNKRYGDVAQGKHSVYTHYFYRLSRQLKKKLSEETLFWNMFPPSSRQFYGFEDPTFYRGNRMVGGVVSHDRYLFLYPTEKERKALEQKKIKLIKEK
ncbi:hypothetical protein HYU19_05045 [Candidatus Woesearchaeota archaeon]|nr:hypothetical protein [Candidatus Woesearchaeota archaeon]